MDPSTSASETKLRFSGRWLRDGLRVIQPPGGIVSLQMDMTACASLIADCKTRNTPVSYAAIFVSATARALARHPRLTRLIAGNRQLTPGAVDICLSVAGDAVVTPVVIIENAETKHAHAITAEIREKTPIARQNDRKLIELLDHWGWLIPLQAVRRGLLRYLLQKLWYRRRVSGTFQVTILPELDLVIPLLFNTAAALGIGRVVERPAVVNGEVRALLTAPFTCALDHTQWTGIDAQTFLKELKQILETEVTGLLQPDNPEAVPRHASAKA
jgi:hypothetical protein